MLDLKKLKSLREKLNLTLEEAAKRAGFTNRQQWYLIESGRRADVRLSTLDNLGKALGLKAKELLK
jgi:transcriptional regulator with XRE-family HTH domain